MKKKFILSFIILSFFGNYLFSQEVFWEKASTLPALINTITMNKEGVILGASAGNSITNFLYVSETGGKTWVDISKNIPSAVDPELSGLEHTAGYKPIMEKARCKVNGIFTWGEYFVLNNGDKQFVGDFIWISNNKGKSWTKIASSKFSSGYIFFENDTKAIYKEEYLNSNIASYKVSYDLAKTWAEISVNDFRQIQAMNLAINDKKFYYYHTARPNSVLKEYKKYSNEQIWHTSETFNKIPGSNDNNIYPISVLFNIQSEQKYQVVRPSKILFNWKIFPDEKDTHICERFENNTWKTVSQAKFFIDGFWGIDCNNYIYATIETPQNSFCRSKDGGKTWEKLLGLPVYNPTYGTYFAPDDRFYHCHEGTLYRSKNKIGCYNISSESTNDYNIVFYAYGPTNLVPKSNEDLTLKKSPTGHIYVGFFKNKEIEKVKGLSPTGLNLDWGKVDENTNERYLLGYHTHCFAVKVTKNQYYEALKLSKSYYFSPINDCVSYADDVADLLGLKTPNTTDAVLLPFTYLELLKGNNKGEGTGSEFCNIKPRQSEHIENKNEKIEETVSIGTSKVKYGTIKTLQGSNLNVRSEPSDKATIINKAPNGEKVKILGEDDKIVTVNGEKGKWLKIEYGGKVGWVWGNFIVK
jgi:hypothetical protein